MSGWTPEQWAVIITAALGGLGSCIATVIHALKSYADRQEIKERLASVETAQLEHEKNAERRSRLPLAGRLRPPAPP